MKKSLWIMAVSLAVLLVAAGYLGAQPQPAPQAGPDPIGAQFFPPDLIMQHQQAIGLRADQREFIKSEMQKTQSRLTDLQWQLQTEMEAMIGLVSQARVDEVKTLAQLDKILNIEREIKRTHFSLLIRIKNILTPEQRARLEAIKKQGRR
ncbi:MAG TPA: periplasmic heavy metal sensor [bacterium]|jgi:Spy/CpxP family protein refolding chaperone|nr:periplasmic heavy metal sensor [bacterium]